MDEHGKSFATAHKANPISSADPERRILRRASALIASAELGNSAHTGNAEHYSETCRCRFRVPAINPIYCMPPPVGAVIPGNAVTAYYTTTGGEP